MFANGRVPEYQPAAGKTNMSTCWPDQSFSPQNQAAYTKVGFLIGSRPFAYVHNYRKNLSPSLQPPWASQLKAAYGRRQARMGWRLAGPINPI